MTNLAVQVTAIRSMDVAAFDADGDKDVDLVVAHEFGPNLLFFNDGKGVFELAAPPTDAGHVQGSRGDRGRRLRR
jgi:hypothetical protein